MNAEAIAEALCRGEFAIDCPKMELRQEWVKRPKVFIGSGYIKQTDLEHLEFRAYCRETCSRKVPLLVKMLAQPVDDKSKAGEFVRRKAFYRVHTTDPSGWTWSARTLPHQSWSSGFVGCIISGSPFSLVGKRATGLPRRIKNYHKLDLYFPKRLEIPANTRDSLVRTIGNQRYSESHRRGGAKFVSQGMEFLWAEHEAYLRMRVDLSKARTIPPNLDTRIQEALRFALGHNVLCVLVEQTENRIETIAVSPAEKNYWARGLPPIQLRVPQDSGSAYAMFDRYLSFTLKDGSHNWHPLSWYVYLVNKAQTFSPDEQALLLAVAVEGVAGRWFRSVVKKSTASVSDLSRARDIIATSSSLSDETRRRVCSAIDSWKNQVRAIDILRELERHRVIGQLGVRAWERVRNRAAHGQRPNVEDRRISLRLWRDCQAILTTFHHMVFKLIGYRGNYTNYAIRRWPKRHYRSR